MASNVESWTIQTWPKDGPTPVRIYLWDTKSRETIAHRIICLFPPSYEVKIGRGSQSEPNLRPQEDNAWFTARVMSRDHAILRADPETHRITLEDSGSMHGTYVNDIRLEQGRRVTIENDDTIRFGTEIVRGELTYVPLELQIQSAWPERCEHNPTNSRPVATPRSRNSFSANYSEDEEDDDDDDDDDDDEIEMIYESNHITDPDSDHQSRTFSVPDSDVSVSSIIETCNVVHSAPSSPPDVSIVEHKDKPAPMPTASEILANKEMPLCGFSSILPGSTFQNAMDVSDDEDQELADLDHIEEELENQEMEDGEIDYPSEESSEEEHSSDQGSDDSDAEFKDEVQGTFAPVHDPAPTFPAMPLQTESRIRAPSPSDAALPKSPWHMAEAPAMQNVIDQTSGQPLAYHEPFHTTPTMMPPPGTFTCYYGGGWQVGSDTNTAFVGSPDQQFRAYPGQHSANWRYPFTSHHDLGESVQPRHSTQVADVPSQNKSSKVSINNIIDSVTTDSVNPTPRKRKANELSTVDVEEESVNPVSEQVPFVTAEIGASLHDEILHTESIESHAPVVEALQTMEPVANETAVEDVESIIVSAIEPNIADQDRPHKKAKLEHRKQSSSFFKFAATAAVGAAVGAVGTVLGLAALPAEYFA